MDKYKELIERLRTHALGSRDWPSMYGWAIKDCDEAADAIEELLKASEKPTGWIPVSERLPEESGWYIATAGGEPTFRWYSQSHGFEWYSEIPITAWMPLPEPYGGEEE